MTDDKMALVELLQKSGDGDFLRAVAEAVLQILMEADVEGLIGAGRHERSAERLNYRNGYRERSLDTRLGSLQLRIPKLRQGSYFPPFLEPRKTAEKALVCRPSLPRPRTGTFDPKRPLPCRPPQRTLLPHSLRQPDMVAPPAEIGAPHSITARDEQRIRRCQADGVSEVAPPVETRKSGW